MVDHTSEASTDSSDDVCRSGAGGRVAEALSDDRERETEQSEANRQQELVQVFERITGSVTLVESQDRTVTKRCIEDTDRSVLEYVNETTRADGLSDAISPPESNDTR